MPLVAASEGLDEVKVTALTRHQPQSVELAGVIGSAGKHGLGGFGRPVLVVALCWCSEGERERRGGGGEGAKDLVFVLVLLLFLIFFFLVFFFISRIHSNLSGDVL